MGRSWRCHDARRTGWRPGDRAAANHCLGSAGCLDGVRKPLIPRAHTDRRRRPGSGAQAGSPLMGFRSLTPTEQVDEMFQPLLGRLPKATDRLRLGISGLTVSPICCPSWGRPRRSRWPTMPVGTSSSPRPTSLARVRSVEAGSVTCSLAGLRSEIVVGVVAYLDQPSSRRCSSTESSTQSPA